MLDQLEQAHTQVQVACELAQAFAQTIRGRNAPALEPWLEETLKGGVPELRTFAAGIKRDTADLKASYREVFSCVLHCLAE
jgi:transposase